MLVPKVGRELQLLVEAVGRINFSGENGSKGIGDVAAMTGNWSAKCLSLERATSAASVAENLREMPVFHRGELSITGASKDTYLDTMGLAVH